MASFREIYPRRVEGRELGSREGERKKAMGRNHLLLSGADPFKIGMYRARYRGTINLEALNSRNVKFPT